jgi:hypothetical protein
MKDYKDVYKRCRDKREDSLKDPSKRKFMKDLAGLALTGALGISGLIYLSEDSKRRHEKKMSELKEYLIKNQVEFQAEGPGTLYAIVKEDWRESDYLRENFTESEISEGYIEMNKFSKFKKTEAGFKLIEGNKYRRLRKPPN